jgi:hypothetical protein
MENIEDDLDAKELVELERSAKEFISLDDLRNKFESK